MWEDLIPALLTLSLLAGLVEQATELYRRHLSDAASLAVATALGLAAAFAAGFGVFSAIGFPVRYPWLDLLFTGVLIAGGSKMGHTLLEYSRRASRGQRAG